MTQKSSPSSQVIGFCGVMQQKYGHNGAGDLWHAGYYHPLT